jgi:hypothetical protein
VFNKGAELVFFVLDCVQCLAQPLLSRPKVTAENCPRSALETQSNEISLGSPGLRWRLPVLGLRMHMGEFFCIATRIHRDISQANS